MFGLREGRVSAGEMHLCLGCGNSMAFVCIEIIGSFAHWLRLSLRLHRLSIEHSLFVILDDTAFCIRPKDGAKPHCVKYVDIYTRAPPR